MRKAKAIIRLACGAALGLGGPLAIGAVQAMPARMLSPRSHSVPIVEIAWHHRKRHGKMALSGPVRLCLKGHGWHIDPFGGRVYGFWSSCRIAYRRCAVGHGWHYDPQGNQVFGNFSTCRITATAPR